MLSGAEDLVPVAGPGPGAGAVPAADRGTVRPDRACHATSPATSGRCGPRTGCSPGTAPPARPARTRAWRDPAVVADPGDPDRIFGWRITQTQDLLGNLIRYDYLPDAGEDGPAPVESPADLPGSPTPTTVTGPAPSFLVTVDFEYEPRPDPFSDYRAGFEMRTTLRCHTIRVTTHAADGITRVAREYRLGYTAGTVQRRLAADPGRRRRHRRPGGRPAGPGERAACRR